MTKVSQSFGFSRIRSSPNSLTPSIDSDTSECKCDAASALNGEFEEEFVTVISLEDTSGALDSENPSAVEASLEKGHEDFKSVYYRGTMTWPLSHFGSFELKYETKDLPWISDHTSGVVHPDMHTISMLFNEDLALPEAARKFVEQSSVLKEEARWERVKAAFYSFYPEGMKKTVFEVLSGMSPRDASRIVAKKTSRFENEIVLILRPKVSDPFIDSDSETEAESNVGAEICSEEDAMKLNKLLPEIAREYKENIASALEDFESINNKVLKHNSFGAGNGILTTQQVKEQSVSWTKELKDYQEATQKCIEARLVSHHLAHAVARYEPRTGWIHVKTQLLRRGMEENTMLPKKLFGIKISSEYKIKGTFDAQNAAVDKQMALFEKNLRNLGTGHLNTLDFYHNLPSWHEYEIHIPYESIDPSTCTTITRELLPQGGWNSFHIASKPQISPYEKSHHELVVYIDLKRGKVPQSSTPTFNATAEYKDRYGCCLNCFSRDHVIVECEQPVYSFANPLGERGK